MLSCSVPCLLQVLRAWGSAEFFLPHMITVDYDGNLWVTGGCVPASFTLGVGWGGANKRSSGCSTGAAQEVEGVERAIGGGVEAYAGSAGTLS